MAGNPAFIFMNPTLFISLTDPAVAPDFVCEVTRVEITNNVNMVDTGSLCGPAQQPGKIEWTLELEGYQAYETATLWRFLWDNVREHAYFTLVPKDATVGPGNPAITGEIICVPGTLGGTREEVAAFSVSLPMIGDPVLADTMPVGTTMAAQSSSSAA